ncbi:MAG: hypothetical protein KME08_07605 [Aphanothece sp. CMT-3BRIN-NPC111]|jgi:hypothetical protein|nr:hypothetical protein [Aphanothece sp. CMT-3BRIN-NPC111]
MKCAPLVETPEARKIFQNLFLELYSIEEPILRLDRIMHWVRRFGIETPNLDKTPTLVLGGCFYNTSTPVPTSSEIAEYLEMGDKKGVHQFLIPTIRNNASVAALRSHGFQPIPWFIEAIYEIKNGVDDDLRSQLGGKRFREILRLVRMAEKDYEFEFYTLEQIRTDPSILKTTADIHEFNVNKYGHAINFYSYSILKHISESVLGENLLICIYRDKETSQEVQASISLLDQSRSQMYTLVQGIDQEKIRKGHNLYIADKYQRYKFAERHGIREINLGRGNEELKLKLGANKFNLLNNWVANSETDVTNEIRALVSRSREVLGLAETGQSLIGGYPIE